MELTDEMAQDLTCDMEFIARFRYGHLPSILIMTQIIEVWTEMETNATRMAKEGFQIPSVKLLLAFFLLMDSRDHLKHVVIVAVHHMAPSETSILAISPKVDDVPETCTLEVESITYTGVNDTKCLPWELSACELLNSVQESMFGHLCAAAGED